MHPVEVREILDTALKNEQLKSMDIVEFNPSIGNVEVSTQSIKDVFKDLTTSKLFV